MTENLNSENVEEENMIRKIGPFRRKSKFRFVWGELDLISSILFLGGLYLSQQNCFLINFFACQTFGLLIAGLGVLKQVSKK